MNIKRKHSIQIISLITFICIPLITLALFYFLPKNKTIEDSSSGVLYTKGAADMIIVASPLPHATVGQQFSITGEARGPWYFEASFPIELLRKDGSLITSGIGKAKDNWMTTDFVHFTAEISTPKNFTGEATLLLKKDNPSGLPENDASISFPIMIISNLPSK